MYIQTSIWNSNNIDLSGTTLSYPTGSVDSLTGQDLNYNNATISNLNSTVSNTIDLNSTNLPLKQELLVVLNH